MDVNIQLPTESSEQKPSWPKIVLMFLVCFCCAVFFWIMLGKITPEHFLDVFDWKVFLLRFAFLSLWLILFSSFFTLLALGIPRKEVVLGISLLLSLSIEALLFTTHLFHLVPVIAFSFGCILFGFSLKRSSENFIRLDAAAILTRPLQNFLFFLALAISLSAVFQTEKKDPSIIMKPVLNNMSSYAATMVFGKNMTITQQTTVHEVAKNMVTNLETNQPIFSFILDQNFLKELHNASETIAIAQLEQNILTTLEQPKTNPQTALILDLIETMLEKKIQNILQPYLVFFSYLVGIVVFFTIRFFNPVWIFGTTLVTEFFITLFKTTGFIIISQETRPVERLHL